MAAGSIGTRGGSLAGRRSVQSVHGAAERPASRHTADEGRGVFDGGACSAGPERSLLWYLGAPCPPVAKNHPSRRSETAYVPPQGSAATP